jgi:DNA-binding transcriptional LysR family regulator
LTEAGEEILAQVRPILTSVDHLIQSANAFRDKPMGTLRLAGARPFGAMLMAPLIGPFMDEYPSIRVEISMDDSLSDIVSNRFDAGIRVGHRVERDMTILRVIDEFRMLTVASTAYLERHGWPSHPKDLHAHNCILFRPPWDQTVHWRYAKGGEQFEIVPAGTLTLSVSDADLWLGAVYEGIGIAYLPEPIVAAGLAGGRLVSVLDDWPSTVDGVCLYHPSRRQTPMPLALFIRFIKKRRGGD